MSEVSPFYSGKAKPVRLARLAILPKSGLAMAQVDVCPPFCPMLKRE